jgi:hypothetical protein
MRRIEPSGVSRALRGPLEIALDCDVNIAIRPLAHVAHVAHARIEWHEQRLAPFGLRQGLTEGDTLELLPTQSPDEEVTAPLRESPVT